MQNSSLPSYVEQVQKEVTMLTVNDPYRSIRETIVTEEKKREVFAVAMLAGS